MWYFLTTVVNKKDTLIELNGSYDKMAKYFFSDIEDKRYFENVKFSGIAQKGFTHKLLSQTDYLIKCPFWWYSCVFRKIYRENKAMSVR